jgi:hypothetical protein
MIRIKRLSSTDADFTPRLDALLAFESAQDEAVEQTVADDPLRREGARRCGSDSSTPAVSMA